MMISSTSKEGHQNETRRFSHWLLESRVATRAMLEKAERDPGTVIRVNIVHIGCDGTGPFPPPSRIEWEDGVTEIVHTAG